MRPVPPQSSHFSAPAFLPLPLHIGQIASPVCGVPGAASSPGLRCASALTWGTGEEGVIMASFQVLKHHRSIVGMRASRAAR
jgi:hypothetical protein